MATALLERADPLGVLAAAPRRTSAAGVPVLVSGEAGIGKTRLVERFVRDRAAGAPALGRLRGAGTPHPLGPLHDIARTRARARCAAARRRPHVPRRLRGRPRRTRERAVAGAARRSRTSSGPTRRRSTSCVPRPAHPPRAGVAGAEPIATTSSMARSSRRGAGHLPARHVTRIALPRFTAAAVDGARRGRAARRSDAGAARHDRRQSVLRDRGAAPLRAARAGDGARRGARHAPRRSTRRLAMCSSSPRSCRAQIETSLVARVLGQPPTRSTSASRAACCSRTARAALSSRAGARRGRGAMLPPRALPLHAACWPRSRRAARRVPLARLVHHARSPRTSTRCCAGRRWRRARPPRAARGARPLRTAASRCAHARASRRATRAALLDEYATHASS